MRILNTSGREQKIAGVGSWAVDGVVEIYDEAVIEGVLRNPWFEPDAEQHPDVDPPEWDLHPLDQQSTPTVTSDALPVPDSESITTQETPPAIEEAVPTAEVTPRMARSQA